MDPDNTRMMTAALERAGVPVRSKIYHGVAHGVGPASGTAAENWMKEAVEFWRRPGVCPAAGGPAGREGNT